MKQIRFLLAVLMAFVFTARAWAQTNEAYAVLSTDGTTLTFYYDEMKDTRQGTAFPIPWKGFFPGWCPDDNATPTITTVDFDDSFDNYHGLTTARYMFYGQKVLTTINHIERLHTEHVTTMYGMFAYCYKLRELDLSSFDTSNVTDMGFMFQECKELASLDVSNFNTASVTNMFYMFNACKTLKSLNLTSFNTSEVENMENMFDYCISLTTIYCNDDWSKGKVQHSGSMFDRCSQLKGAVSYEIDNEDVTYANPTTGYFTDAIPIDAAHFPDGNFRAWLLEQDYGQDGLLTGAEIAQVTEIDVHYKHIADLTGIEYFKALTDLNCSMNQLTTIDVSKNTALKKLNCSAQDDGNGTLLTSLDVSELTALEILDCSNSKMTSLDVSNNKALRMLSCFGCHLTSLDLSQNTELTFLDCRSNHYQLTTLDLSQNIKLRDLIIYANRINGSGMEAL